MESLKLHPFQINDLISYDYSLLILLTGFASAAFNAL